MSSEDPDRCGYVFDPDEWEATSGISSSVSDSVLDESGVWRCPHRSEDARELCLFHLPPDETDASEVKEQFLSRLEDRGRSAKQFIGARFGELDLAHVVLDGSDNYPLDLRHSTFAETLSLRYAVVRQPLNLEATTFQSTVDCMETRFRNEVYLSHATFESDARFYEARFTQGGWFYKSAFAEANFHRSVFRGPADFIESEFDTCHFQEALFEDQVNFDKCRFEHASFPGVTFEGAAYFDEATFPEQATFTNSEFATVGSFTDLGGVEETCCIDLQDSIIRRGALVPPPDPDLVFDLRDATVGDVDITTEPGPDDLLQRFRVFNTTFEGFDFGAYRDALVKADWTIHDVVAIPQMEPAIDSSSSYGKLESTYLKAKNGANDVGDTKAAAEFFRKEMVYRRYQYADALRDSGRGLRNRTFSTWRWLTNGLLGITSGYGERPSRVAILSTGIVVLFAGLFALVTPIQPYGSPIGYLILSLESFVTLVLGGAEQISDPWIRLLAQVEGFIGAFLIALFVFTLTRSIHR